MLTLHPHVTLWSAADKLNEKNISFASGKELPFIGFLRVDGVLYCFMGSEKLSMQAIAHSVNYISYQAKALDGKKHDGAIYFEVDSSSALQLYE
ncbi:DUF4964 domain-containing protein [Bacteroides luhongzhouii]|uniref:DUF4964 domain-containing protein n=1 Tax=Bacteroides luhongzhouii TaxID=2650158 RepID=UPI001CB85D0B